MLLVASREILSEVAVWIFIYALDIVGLEMEVCFLLRMVRLTALA